MKIERDVELARFTTLGTGGPARAFARPESADDLREALGWAAAEGLDVVPIGLGSNLLAADEGVEALVLKLAGELAAVEVDGTILRAGGGARPRSLPAAPLLANPPPGARVRHGARGG